MLDVIAGLAAENRTPAGAAPALDSDLERDLGLDSLSRSELLLRLERAFQVSLPERTLAASTPRELLHAVLAAGARTNRSASHSASRSDNAPLSYQTDAALTALPAAATTLPEVLDWHAARQPERTALYLYGDSDEPTPISYAALQHEARALAAGLRAWGLEPGQAVAIMLPTERGYFASFYGILLAGGTPVPIYPPARPNQLEEHLHRHARILANAGCVLLITVPAAKLVARLLQAQVASLRAVVTVPELTQTPRGWANHPTRGEDIAFLQYTSGSTGDPKGVILSHANVLANIRALASRVAVSSDDVFVSWLPLYHDMGLIGACLGSLYQGIPLAVMSPLRFLRRPASWLWAIHRHRGSLSAGPNFAYELCLRNISDDDIQGLDLSRWRWAFNGAEPVSPITMRRFGERFARYGLLPAALAPVYGLAECSVGLALPAPGRGLKTERLQRALFTQRGVAAPAAVDEQDTLETVACGHALAGHEIRIVDDAGRELPPRREGLLQFKGPSATRGYLHNPAATQALFDGDWLNSGDRGYIAEGDIYLTGRVKDLIIRGGRNLYPYELEQAVGELEGVRKGCVAVFASTDPEAGTERLVVVAETRLTDPARRHTLQEHIRNRAVDLLGSPPDDIVLVPPHTVLKTSSGKIRRSAVRALYERQALRQGNRALWWQLVRLTAGSAVPQLRRWLARAGEYLYAGYAWVIFGALAALAWPLVLLMPRADWRWALGRALSRSALRLTAIPLAVDGLEQIPVDGPCVLVANHSSYLDAIVLMAALPRPFRFVAKRELAANWLLGPALERLGVAFVERFDQQRASADGERLVRAAHSGAALAFFPEGTFTRSPGLLPFRMGAFVAAAQAQTPLLPVAIRGTRALLRADSWFPRRATLHVTCAALIQPQATDWTAALALREAARAVLLRLSGEPDLASADSPLTTLAKPQADS